MSLQARLAALVTAVGADIKALREGENLFIQPTRPTTTIPSIWIEQVGPDPKNLRLWVINV